MQYWTRRRKNSVRNWRVPLASVDGTSLVSRHVSRYYVKRLSRSGDCSQETTYAKYPKAVLVIDCASQMVLAAVLHRSPCANLVQFRAALRQAILQARIGTLLADADIDAEWGSRRCSFRRHNDDHSAKARSADRQATDRTLAASHNTAIRSVQEKVWTMMASRDGQLHN